MAEEKDVNLNTPKEELDGQDEPETVVVEEDDDADALKEKLTKVQDQNKQLYSRAKKGEGFIQGDDGKWVKKPVEVKSEVKPEVKPEEPAPTGGMTKESVNALLEEREVESFDISDSLKQELSSYAKLNKVSVKKALASDYIQFKKDKEADAEKSEDASLGGGTRTTAKTDPKETDLSKLDLRTKEGKEAKTAFDEAAAKELG